MDGSLMIFNLFLPQCLIERVEFVVKHKGLLKHQLITLSCDSLLIQAIK